MMTLSERRIRRVAAYMAANPITAAEMSVPVYFPFPNDHPYSLQSIMQRNPTSIGNPTSIKG